MEVIEGTAYVSINGADEETFTDGKSWTIEAGSYFTVRVEAPLHYVCHFEWSECFVNNSFTFMKLDWDSFAFYACDVIN